MRQKHHFKLARLSVRAYILALAAVFSDLFAVCHRVDHGSGRVTKLEKISGSGRVGSRRSKSKKIVHLSYLTCNESLLLLIESLLPQGGIGKRHSATSRLRH